MGGRGRELWIGSAHSLRETTQDNTRDAFYDKLNAWVFKIPSQQVLMVGTSEANAKMGLEQQSYVLGRWYYPAERTSDNGNYLVDLSELTGRFIASTFKRNHQPHQHTWQGRCSSGFKGTTPLKPEEQRKQRIETFKPEQDYVLNTPHLYCEMRSEYLELFETYAQL
ncbi:hypothetical protein RB195_011194 [Necator americanus]|uniref:Uncharacterized protein n=1 Tax=Necator americanus TaxID=51031 RepID=A0ABR1D3K6_NECAM